VVLAEIFDKTYENGNRSFGERLGISLVVYIGIFALYSMGEFAVSLLGYIEFGKGFTPIGAFLVITLIVIIAVVYIRKYINYKRAKANVIKWEKQLNGEHIPDSLGTIIANIWSAFYDKHCPRITWIDPTDPTDNGTDNNEDLEPIEGAELGVYNDPVLGTTYGLKNITNKESETLQFPNLKD